MNYIDLDVDDVVLVGDGRISKLISVQKVVASPTAQTVMLVNYSPSQPGGWGSPHRKDRGAIIGKLCSDLTPETALQTIDHCKKIESAAVREAHDEFDTAIGAMVE